MRPEALQAKLQSFLPTGKPFDIVGSNLYVVHQRVAQKFRAGRAILAGDSAHVNSPIGAMGMNSGIHDAINLADKLIAIARKEADDSVLDRYERQRRHVAVAHTQAQTMRNKRLVDREGSGGAAAQPRRLAPHRGRSGAGAPISAAHGAVRELARSRRDCVMKWGRRCGAWHFLHC